MLVAKLVPRFPRTNFRPRHDNTLNIVLGGGTWGRRHLGNPKLVLERDVGTDKYRPYLSLEGYREPPLQRMTRRLRQFCDGLPIKLAASPKNMCLWCRMYLRANPQAFCPPPKEPVWDLQISRIRMQMQPANNLQIRMQM